MYCGIRNCAIGKTTVDRQIFVAPSRQQVPRFARKDNRLRL